jgi:hypothetical protein
LVLGVSVALVLLVGLVPARVITWARDSQAAPPKVQPATPNALNTAKAP